MENSLEGADKKRSASFGKKMMKKKERPPGERAAAGTPHYRWMGVLRSEKTRIVDGLLGFHRFDKQLNEAPSIELVDRGTVGQARRGEKRGVAPEEYPFEALTA